MEFTLERLIGDIKTERLIWNLENSDSEKAQAIWDKVAAKNKLSATEAKSIYKVLCKKYRQEIAKPISNWKLFNHLKFLEEVENTEAKGTTQNMSSPHTPSIIEEETYVELLEVKDEDFSDDEYSRSFDGMKSDIEDGDEKEQKDKEFPTSITETEKKDNLRQEEPAEKVTPPAPELNKGKILTPKPNTNLKRKLPDSKDDPSVQGKRSAFVSKIVQNKIIPNGIIKETTQVNLENENRKSKISKYSNFGQYVESTLNRLSPRLAARLEIKILQSIIDVSSEMMNRLE